MTAALHRRHASTLGATLVRRMNRVKPSPIALGSSQTHLRNFIVGPTPAWPHVILTPPYRSFSSETVKITYIEPSGEEHTVDAVIGKHLMDVAHDNNIELEGACGGELACSTCHLIFEKDVYDTLPPKSDEEEDMLDLAVELTDTSRLGCQIRVTKDLDGIKVRMPNDGY